MTTQTTLSDAELIVKGYNAVVADAQDEFEYIKEEVLLQLEDLDEDFDTYREFELRLEAYENGAFDPDIEKIWGIGGRKAGTWNPRSEKAKENRARGRLKSKGSVGEEDAARIQDADAATRYRQAGQIHQSQFKGARPGGKLKGQGGGYKGGENISDRDSFAGAIARKIVGGKRKAKEAPGAAKDKAAGVASRATDAAKSKVEAGSQALARGGEKVAGGGRAVADRGKKVGSTIAGVGAGLGRVGALAGRGVAGAASEAAKNTKAAYTDKPRTSHTSNLTPASIPGSIANQGGVAGRGNKAKTHSGGYLSKEEEYWASKSFTDRLRKSMGYRPRRRYDDRLPW